MIVLRHLHLKMQQLDFPLFFAYGLVFPEYMMKVVVVAVLVEMLAVVGALWQRYSLFYQGFYQTNFEALEHVDVYL